MKMKTEKMVKVTKMVRARINKVVSGAKKYCVGQDHLVEMLVYSTLTNEHSILIGPPGCNKSQVIDYWTSHLADDSNQVFRATLSKESSPEALVGPFDPRALKERGVWVRNLENTMADERCYYAHISEIFSARGSTLRELVRVLNEREIENGGKRIKLNLRSVFSDSNYLPLEENDAVFDRFLFRARVDYLPTNNQGDFLRMLKSNDVVSNVNGISTIGLRAIDLAKKDIASVELPDAVLLELFNLRAKFAGNASMAVSDRRWKKACKALRAIAWCRDSYMVEARDLYALRFILFNGENADEVNSVLEQYRYIEPAMRDQEYVDSCLRVYEHASASNERSIIANAISQLEEASAQVLTSAARGEIMRMVDDLTARVAL